MIRVKSLFRGGVVAGLPALLSLLSFAADAQSYPSGPVRVIVPFPPGGGVDGMGRVVAQKLTENLNRSFVVENRGGANGNIGTELAAHAPKDGYTLLATGAGLVTNPSLYRRTGYDPARDFEPIALVAVAPNVLVVHPSVPAKSVAELIALARARPEMLQFAGSGSGSTPHLAGELFNTLAGVRMVHVPYRGTGPAIVGLVAGEVGVMFMPATNAVQLVRAGRVRGLAVTSTTRLDALPELPTVAAAGLKGYASSQWYGWLAPAGTPEEIVNFLNAQIASVMRAADVRQRLGGDGVQAVGSTRAEFAAHIREEITKWARVIKASGARID